MRQYAQGSPARKLAATKLNTSTFFISPQSKASNSAFDNHIWDLLSKLEIPESEYIAGGKFSPASISTLSKLRITNIKFYLSRANITSFDVQYQPPDPEKPPFWATPSPLVKGSGRTEKIVPLAADEYITKIMYRGTEQWMTHISIFTNHKEWQVSLDKPPADGLLQTNELIVPSGFRFLAFGYFRKLNALKDFLAFSVKVDSPYTLSSARCWLTQSSIPFAKSYFSAYQLLKLANEEPTTAKMANIFTAIKLEEHFSKKLANRVIISLAGSDWEELLKESEAPIAESETVEINDELASEIFKPSTA